MKKLFLTLLSAVMLLPTSATIKVHTIGDSTMETYDESATDKRGWATYLGAFFDNTYVTVNNRGKSGCSSRTFYTGAAQWGTVPAQFSAGDYLIIQFAHNDEKNNGMDVDTLNAYYTSKGHALETDMRGTHPQTTYKAYLRKYINEARAAQVNPILMAPVARKYFNGNSIKRSGLHDLGDKFWRIDNGVLNENASVPASDHSMDYVQAMREVAEEMNVPFLDMTSATRDLYLQYGEAQCTSLLFCQGDNTHFATMGANLVARLAAQMLKDSIPALAPYITIPTSITANPSSLDMGETYEGVPVKRELLFTGFGLNPASGTVSFTASGDLQISLTGDEGTYSQSLQTTYQGATLFQRIYVKAVYTEGGAQSDTITAVSGEQQVTVAVTASILSLAGGTDIHAEWPIEEKPASLPLEAICGGPVSGAMTLSLMQATDTKTDVTIDAATGATVVRFHNADATGAKTNWPTDEIDENANRYVDFALTAPATMEVRITKIRMWIGAYSTSAMKCHINTGFGAAFTDVHTIYEASQTALPNKAMNLIELTPTLTIPAGETLHLRVLPWHEHSSGSGKYLLLRDVRIEGKAFEPNEDGIEDISDGQSTAARKILRDGQLLILRDGKVYTVQGQEAGR